MARTKGKMKTKTLAILIGLGVAVVGGGIAFAFFTNVGSGAGTAGTGSNNPVVVKQTSTVSAMAPGIAPQALSGNFDNPNPGPVFIKSVTAAVTAVSVVTPSPALPAGTPACTITDFVIGTPGVTPGTTQTATAGIGAGGNGVEIPAGTAQGTWGNLNLAFFNKSTNQDACKNSTVTITYTANAS